MHLEHVCLFLDLLLELFLLKPFAIVSSGGELRLNKSTPSISWMKYDAVLHKHA